MSSLRRRRALKKGLVGPGAGKSANDLSGWEEGQAHERGMWSQERRRLTFLLRLEGRDGDDTSATGAAPGLVSRVLRARCDDLLADGGMGYWPAERRGQLDGVHGLAKR